MISKVHLRVNWPIRYAGALLAVGIAWLLRLGLVGLAGPDLPLFITFFPAVMCVALLGGFGPGLLATIAVVGVVDYWLVPPYGSFAIGKPSDAIALAFFGGMGIFMSAVAELYRRAHAQAVALKEAPASDTEAVRRTENWTLNVAMALSLVIMLTAGLLAFRFIRSLADADQGTTHTYLVQQELEQLVSGLEDAEAGERGYLLTGQDSYLQPYTAARPAIARHLAALDLLTRDNASQQRRLALLQPLIQQKLATLKHNIDLRRTSGLPALLRVLDAEGGKKIMDQIRAQVAAGQTEEQQLLALRSETKNRQIGDVIKVLVGGGLFSFLALSVVFLFLKQENRRRQSAQEQLRQHRDQLQEMVEARTRQLEQSNFELNRAVAEQGRANAVLLESEERIRFALETSQIGTWDLDLESHQANRSAVHGRIFGYVAPLPEWTYEKFLEHVLPEDRQAVTQAFGRAMESRSDWTIECRIRRRDGETRWVWVAARHLAGAPGTKGRLSGIIQDITARKQAEETLLLSQELFSKAFADNPAAIALTRYEGGDIVDVNDTWTAMTGYSREEVMGHSARHMWTNVTDARRFLDELREHGTLHGWEQEFRKKTGELYTTQISAQILKMRGEEMILTTLVDITARKHAERALRESEANLQHFINTAPIGLVRNTRDLHFRLVNNAYAALVGRPIDQVIGHSLADVIGEKGLAGIRPYIEQVLQGHRVEFEADLPLESGIVHVYVIYEPDRNAAGEIIGWVGSIADVTKQRDAESQLRLLSAAVQSAVDAVVITDASGTIQWVNPAFASLTGYSAAEAIGRNPRVLKSGRHSPGFYAGLWETITSGQVWSSELVNKRKDGTLYTEEMTITPVANADGYCTNFIAIKRDITDRKRHEEARAQLAAIVEWSEDGILSESLAGIIQTWNAGAERMFGYPAKEVVGRPITILLPAGRIDEETEVMARLSRGETIQHYETVRLARDGRQLDVALTVSPVKDQQGRMIGASTIVRDIGELVEARRVLTRSKEELEKLVVERTAKLQELVGELEHFSYTIIHDMRAPLRAMQGFAEMLEQGNQDAESQMLLHRIVNAARRMDMLITDALNYNQTVRQELALSAVDAGELLRGMLETYPEFQAFRACIEVAGRIPSVLANEAGLTQCFSNLLGNAIKFVQPGQAPQIRVWAQVSDGWVRLCVEDQGVGIPATMLPRIFDMFSRGHQSYPGTGIGLALVRKVMERMGGKVTVESEEGQGARFWLFLRAATPS